MLPNRLREWSAEHDVSMTDIADLAGYSVAYMSLVARGKRRPSAAAKVAIARALGVRVRDLFPATPAPKDG